MITVVCSYSGNEIPSRLQPKSAVCCWYIGGKHFSKKKVQSPKLKKDIGIDLKDAIDEKPGHGAYSSIFIRFGFSLLTGCEAKSNFNIFQENIFGEYVFVTAVAKQVKKSKAKSDFKI